jgi:hypothetical protein
MLQTLKTLLDERLVVSVIEIDRDADLETEEDLSVEVPHVVLFDKAEVSSEEPNWSDKIESAESELVQNDKVRQENALAIDTDGGEYGEKIVLEEIQMDPGDVNHNEIAVLEEMRCRNRTKPL